MRDVLDDDLAELYPVRASDDVRLARLREQLFAEKPRSRSRRWAGIAAAAVAVVMITGLVVTLRPASRDAPATLPVKPAASLPEAATLLEVAEQPTAKYRRITYRIWQVMGVGEPYASSAIEFEFDVWLPTAADEMVVIYRRPTGAQRPVAGAQRPTSDFLMDSSRNPVLWKSFCASTPCKEETVGQPLSAEPGRRLDDAAAAMLSPFTTNEEKAALYRRIAESPQVRWDNGKVSADGGARLFLVDPATGQVTGMEERRSNDPRIPAHTVTTSVAITYEWTDQRPS
ncbi:hypothetical protein SAMN04488074_11812 [Lentzea albidocapillata subsp. violacea]|uniref:Uncharacterized protein n=1 Tax=Lentzea albidocapillata subsp. violacea TaxID=128104 RepID=A0A1G9R7V4_9PSEU|nr:hypothetical protein [Lentzea albidocapillata]SDM19210.1 hypothetical protein SAMN04488074_11812 [Lentzea albidocapillata subsp. violacea]